MDKNQGEATTAPVAKSSEPQPMAVHFIDRPECLETFADSISGLFFDGQTLHVEFAVTRLQAPGPAGEPTTGRRYPVCRMVLPPAAAIDLINKMQQIGSALTRAGVAKIAPPAK